MRTIHPAGLGTGILSQIAGDPSQVAALHGAVGDFCHLLRNRLHTLQMSLYLARRDARGGGGSWDELDRQYRATEEVVELFQLVCRPMRLAPITVGLDLVLREFESRWSPRFAEQGLRFSTKIERLDGPSRLDPSAVAKGLDALAAWRLERAAPGREFLLAGRVAEGISRIEWREDGPAPGDPDGDLPLAALARVASEHGGAMTEPDADGWRVRLEWPRPGGGGSTP